MKKKGHDSAVRKHLRADMKTFDKEKNDDKKLLKKLKRK